VLRLDEHLCFALYAASHAFTRAYAPLLAELGLTYPQYIVMIVLWERDDLSVKQLGERLSLDSGTLTPLLKRLEQSGLVSRHRDAGDERVVRVRLTSAGAKMEEKAQHIPTTLVCRAGYDETKKSLRQIGELRTSIVELTRALDAAASVSEPTAKKLARKRVRPTR
jgi:DNA-binding MarR family transcriptional regulator